MLYLVSFSEKNLSIKLYSSIKNHDINELLTEYDEVENERKSLQKNILELTNAKKMIDEIL